MPDVREFLQGRWSELSMESAPLQKQIANLDLELLRLKECLAKIEEERGEVARAAAAIGLKLEERTDQRGGGDQGGGLTIKAAILKVLEEHPEGLTSNAILDEINARYFGGRIERTSFSPQLSRLKAAGEIASEGAAYFRAIPFSQLQDETIPASGNRNTGVFG